MAHQTRNLLFAGIIIGGFLGCHQAVVNHISATQVQVEPTSELPNFALIENIPSRKQEFFSYLEPFVERENARLSALRNDLSNKSVDELKRLADEYGVDPSADDLPQRLRKRIDMIPTSLVLVQAAVESAWGTSRFARQGNNLFGQWCFTKGCGIVPQSRAAGANHEVRRFASPQDSIRSYMHNLNSHRAYAKLRRQRAAQRQKGEPLSGCYLAAGLTSYSEKGNKYVELVKSMIRGNRLETQNAQYCAPRMVAEPKETQVKEPAKKDQG